MDIDTLRGLGTLFAFIAFLSVCVWAYSKRQKPRFDEAAQLPFADEPVADEPIAAQQKPHPSQQSDESKPS